MIIEVLLILLKARKRGFYVSFQLTIITPQSYLILTLKMLTLLKEFLIFVGQNSRTQNLTILNFLIYHSLVYTLMTDQTKFSLAKTFTFSHFARLFMTVFFNTSDNLVQMKNTSKYSSNFYYLYTLAWIINFINNFTKHLKS